MRITSDTGYKDQHPTSRCYWVGNRTVVFDDETTPEEIQSFIDTEKKGWCGQEFSAKVSGKTVHIRKAVDSGD